MYRLDGEVSHRLLCCALYQVSLFDFCLPVEVMCPLFGVVVVVGVSVSSGGSS